jgi:hypothetical protein
MPFGLSDQTYQQLQGRFPGQNIVSVTPGAAGASFSPIGTGYSTSGASNIFGSRVGAIPPITGPNLGGVYPNLSGTNAALSSSLASELTGQLSPQTIAAINDAAASWGVTSGMPGSGLAMNRFPRDIGLASEDLINRGIGNYSSVIPSVSATQTVSPAQAAPLNTEIAAMNAINAAAPDPAAAGSYAQNLFDRYLKSLSTPAGGTGSAGVPWWAQGSGFGQGAGGTVIPGGVVSRIPEGAGGGVFNLQPTDMTPQMVGAVNPTDPSAAYANWQRWMGGIPTGPPLTAPSYRDQDMSIFNVGDLLPSTFEGMF